MYNGQSRQGKGKAIKVGGKYLHLNMSCKTDCLELLDLVFSLTTMINTTQDDLLVC